jgi:hypothetical protein
MVERAGVVAEASAGDAAARRVDSGPAGSAPLRSVGGPGAVPALQRTAGNRARGRWLARDPLRGTDTENKVVLKGSDALQHLRFNTRMLSAMYAMGSSRKCRNWWMRSRSSGSTSSTRCRKDPRFRRSPEHGDRALLLGVAA